MHKKIALWVGLFLIVSPAIVSAQTTNNSSLLATLEALVQQLEQDLQRLIAAKSSSTMTTQTQSTTVSSTTSSRCAQFTNLQKGDTDPTTNGEVSQLQTFLGISPITGYYGAQTSIGYQNKCGNLNNSQPASVAGMSEYTDPSFGFSFWYPSGWTVTQGSPPVIALKRLLVSSPDGQEEFYVDEIDSTHGVTTLDGACYLNIYFGPNAGQWMQQTSGCDSAPGTSNGITNPAQTADTSVNTMGGLHEFTTIGTGSTVTSIPLSAQDFVMVSTFGQDQYGSQEYLANTVVATNPNVATPVSTGQQTATIESEANEYGANTSNSSSASVLQFYASPISANSLNVNFEFAYNAGAARLAFGDGQSVSFSSPGCPANPDGMIGQLCSYDHAYGDPGSYTASLRNLAGNVLATQTVRVTSSPASAVTTDFSAAPMSGPAPLTVTFSYEGASSVLDSPPSGYATAQIDFGDGSSGAIRRARLRRDVYCRDLPHVYESRYVHCDS